MASVQVTHFRTGRTSTFSDWIPANDNNHFVNLSQVVDFYKSFEGDWIITDSSSAPEQGYNRQWKVSVVSDPVMEKFAKNELNNYSALIDRISDLITELQYHPTLGSKISELKQDFDKNLK